MAARAEFDTTSPARAVVVMLVAILAALLIGGTGGYIVRAVTYSVSNPATDIQRPFVVETAPYSSPAASPSAEPTRDPRGFAVPI